MLMTPEASQSSLEFGRQAEHLEKTPVDGQRSMEDNINLVYRADESSSSLRGQSPADSGTAPRLDSLPVFSLQRVLTELTKPRSFLNLPTAESRLLRRSGKKLRLCPIDRSFGAPVDYP